MARACRPLLFLMLFPLLMAGCEKALFVENMPRTQYERYERLRGRYVPAQRFGPGGKPEPALRERLSPYRQ